MPDHFDYLHLGLAVAATALLFLWLFEVYRLKSVAARARAAEEELAGLRKLPGTHEYRVEQVGVLWHPVVRYEPKTFKVLDIKVGAPLCAACGVPLSAGSGDFSCAKCDFKCPESVASVAILDQIAAKVKGYFALRHPTGL